MDNFHFVCKDCTQKMEDAKRPNIKLKFRAGLSSSPPQAREKRLEQGLPSTVATKSFAIEIPAKQAQKSKPPLQEHHFGLLEVYPDTILKGTTTSSDPHHDSFNTSNGGPQPSQSSFPNKGPPPGSNIPNRLDQFGATDSPPSKLTDHQTISSIVPTREHAADTFRTPSRNTQDHRPIPEYENTDYQLLNSSPEKGANSRQRPHGTVLTAGSQHQAGNRSPVLDRPSMSPTQGNPDVGPVAGVPHTPATNSLLSPALSQAIEVQHHNSSETLDSSCQPTSVHATMNGVLSSQEYGANSDHEPHQHLSGLSPMKQSPSLPPACGLMSAEKAASLTPRLHSANGTRSVSGTAVFPPIERLQPSPKQLSKSPVPTPNKSMTPSSMGIGELKRVNKEILDRAEKGRQNIGGDGDDRQGL